MNRKTSHSLFLFVAIVILGLAASAVVRGAEVPETVLVPITQKTGFSVPNPQGLWRLSPDAPHHRALVRVRCDNGFGGTGVMVSVEGTNALVALTNNHVVTTNKWVKVQAPDNPWGSMQVVWRSPQLDLAVLYRPEGGPWPGALPIAPVNPPVGTLLELCGYGGPTNGLNHVYGKRLGRRDAPIQIDAGTVSGDSGGGIIWNDGQEAMLVGINFGSVGSQSLGRVPESGGWTVHYPSSSNADAADLARVLTQVCTPYGCRPRIIQRPGPIGYPQGPQSQPPSLPPQSQPLPPQSQPPSQQPCEPGEKGPQGDRGEKGEKGDKDDDGE